MNENRSASRLLDDSGRLLECVCVVVDPLPLAPKALTLATGTTTAFRVDVRSTRPISPALSGAAGERPNNSTAGDTAIARSETPSLHLEVSP
jgi:hypothetical protein